MFNDEHNLAPMSDLFAGVLILSSLESSSGVIKRVTAAVSCLVVLIDDHARNGTWSDVAETVNAIDAARKLVLIARAAQDTHEEVTAATRSFGTLLLNETGETRVHTASAK